VFLMPRVWVATTLEEVVVEVVVVSTLEVLETTDDEELWVVDVDWTVLDELVEVEVDCTTLLLETGDVNSYISSLFPAPQYS